MKKAAVPELRDVATELADGVQEAARWQAQTTDGLLISLALAQVHALHEEKTGLTEADLSVLTEVLINADTAAQSKVQEHLVELEAIQTTLSRSVNSNPEAACGRVREIGVLRKIVRDSAMGLVK